MFAPLAALLAMSAATAAPAITNTASLPAAARPASDAMVDAGKDGVAQFAIDADSVARKGDVVAYRLYGVGPEASDEPIRVVVNCANSFRGVVSGPSQDGQRVTTYRVQPDTREAVELERACRLPAGPRSRMSAGLMVSADGIVVVSHRTVYGCKQIVAWPGGVRHVAALVAHENDLSILRIDGGPYATMTPRAAAITDSEPVTMLGVHGTAPFVGAGILMPSGSNPDDSGWPQVEMLAKAVVTDGPVWDAHGDVVGFGSKQHTPRTAYGQVRLLPAQVMRDALQRHGIAWPRGFTTVSADVDGSMRRALAATVPIGCEAAP
jgi:hypothetical protein